MPSFHCQSDFVYWFQSQQALPLLLSQRTARLNLVLSCHVRRFFSLPREHSALCSISGLEINIVQVVLLEQLQCGLHEENQLGTQAAQFLNAAAFSREQYIFKMPCSNCHRIKTDPCYDGSVCKLATCILRLQEDIFFNRQYFCLSEGTLEFGVSNGKG